MANWIIVIDDDAATLKLAGHLLSKAGYRVTALKSGRLALDYVRKNGVPDLFLLDLNMPDLDGFQTLELLRKEMAPGQDIPVIFLTAENRVEQEARGLESGAMDYIRKPFDPDVLINRVRRILDVQTQMNRLAVSAEKDPLTGMLNKAASEALMTRLCSREKGLLCVLDLDAFKSVNDIFGHDTGDRILVMFSQVLSAGLEHPDECGRIGGDEFIVFLRNRKRSEDLENFARKINEDYIAGARAILGDRLNSAIGVSIGAVSVPDYGRDYPELFRLAPDAPVSEVIARCCELKAQVVSRDEKEAGLRAILNYGHTFGHALESVTGYQKFEHGEAVAVGMCMAADLAQAEGLLTHEEALRQENLLKAFHLPVTAAGLGLAPDRLLQAMRHDKKTSGGKIRVVLPVRIGHAEVFSDISPERLTEALCGRI